MLLNHFVRFLCKSPEPVPDSDRGFNFGVMTRDNVAAHTEKVLYAGLILIDAQPSGGADKESFIYRIDLN